MLTSVESRDGWSKCSCCSERLRDGDRRFVLMREGHKVRGGTYCPHCFSEGYAHENHPDLDVSPERDHEREREAYADYRAAGCTDAFWTDRDAGLI